MRPCRWRAEGKRRRTGTELAKAQEVKTLVEHQRRKEVKVKDRKDKERERKEER